MEQTHQTTNAVALQLTPEQKAEVEKKLLDVTGEDCKVQTIYVQELADEERDENLVYDKPVSNPTIH